ncbi:GLPGLI family protein [Chryseobacterium viscerum]|uniref:GLPGLI family protein n=2 Tax=Chryseobacterium viscerum TaxID=1037377 RepID=A0A316WHJ9_9FLAO|nr:GLPGLI family protein [Chryseobacterium viscerum]
MYIDLHQIKIRFMKYLVFFLLLFTQVVLGQNKRFMYQYTYIPDSTNTETIKDLMFLDTANNRSLFYSRMKFTEDSTSIAEAEKKNFYIPNATILYRVEKMNGKTFFLTNDYGLGKIKVEDNRKITWKIESEKQKIGEYSAQKATTDFGGRKWTAWFTTDIPIQDGPYKFSGLPGLIVKIEDATKNHIYELIGIKNLPKEIPFPNLNSRANELALTQQKFEESFIKYRKDPAAAIKQLYIEGKIPDQQDGSGRLRTGAEVVREVEQQTKERVKKDNNIIEISLLKSVK